MTVYNKKKETSLLLLTATDKQLIIFEYEQRYRLSKNCLSVCLCVCLSVCLSVRVRVRLTLIKNNIAKLKFLMVGRDFRSL